MWVRQEMKTVGVKNYCYYYFFKNMFCFCWIWKLYLEYWTFLILPSDFPSLSCFWCLIVEQLVLYYSDAFSISWHDSVGGLIGCIMSLAWYWHMHKLKHPLCNHCTILWGLYARHFCLTCRWTEIMVGKQRLLIWTEK